MLFGRWRAWIVGGGVELDGGLIVVCGLPHLGALAPLAVTNHDLSRAVDPARHGSSLIHSTSSSSVF